jgi:hypothetical protein
VARKGEFGNAKDRVTLFAAIEVAQHEALRRIAFEQHRSISALVREILEEFLSEQDR